MERAPPALAADDHPPSPPPPPTPAPTSLPGTPADYPTPAEHPSPHPDSPPPSNPVRPVRRSARFRKDADPVDSDQPSDHSRQHSPSSPPKPVTTDHDVRQSDEHPQQPPADTNDPTEKPASPHASTEKAPDTETTQPHPAIEPSPVDDHPPDQPNPENDDSEPVESNPPSDPPPTEDAPNPEKDRVDADADAVMDTENTEKAVTDPPDADGSAHGPASSEAPDAAPDAVDNATNDEDPSEKPSAGENRDDDNDSGAGPASTDASAPPAGDREDVENASEEAPRESEPLESDKPVNDDAMDVDQPEMRSEEPHREPDSAMEVEQPNEAGEDREKPAEAPAAEKEVETDMRRKSKSVGDSPGDITDSDDEIRPDDEDVPKAQSPPLVSPPMTRRRLATRASSPPESPPITRRSKAETPKTAPHKSARRSSSSEDVIEIEKMTSSRYETRSSARGSSPMRTRRRRHSEPAPVSEPVAKPRARRTKKYSRKPVKGDRLRVMWHIDNIYYDGVVDSVLAFRGKRFYDITYDSGEREYYLELTHRKWRFADGRDDDVEDEEDDDDQYMRRDIDYSKYPQIGDRILVMWHVDGKYYPGKVNDILKANGAWFYDVNYEGGDREFFLDLTIRKWKYPETSEESGKHPLVDQKIPKSVPRPKPKPKAKPKPKRVARKSIGPGSSAYDADASSPQSPPRPSRKQRTLQMLLDDHDGGIDRSPPQEDSEMPRKKTSAVDEVLDELDRASPVMQEKYGDREDDLPDPGFDVIFDNLDKNLQKTKPASQQKDSPLQDQPRQQQESRTGQDADGDRDDDTAETNFAAIFDNFGKDLPKSKPAGQEKESSAQDQPTTQQDSGIGQRADGDAGDEVADPRLDVVFDNFGSGTMDVLDEMRPPLPSQSVLKRPRAPAVVDASRQEQEKEKDPADVSDILGDLLKRPALPLPSSPSDHLLPSSPPRPRVLAERSRTTTQRDRPLSPLKPQPAPIPRPALNQRPSTAPVQSILKRKLAVQSSGARAAKRQAVGPKTVPKPPSARGQRRLRTIEPISVAPEKPREPSKSGDDPNVSDIVSVAGIVAKKWAREEAGRISLGIDKLKKQLSSLRTLHSKSLIRSRQKGRTVDSRSRILPDDEAEPQINTLGTNIVTLVRKYRDTVEEREKKLKNQFTRMRTKITEQNENLVETADVLSGLDIVGLEALSGLQPKIRKKLEIPHPLPPRQGSQAYTQPPAYALSPGVPRQPYQSSQGAPGSLGQHNDAVVRNLRRRLADLVTRSEWLGDEVKRLQGREKTLFREKTAALTELRKAKRSTAIVDLTTNGKGKGIRGSGRSSLPASKSVPSKPVGITKRRTRASSAATAVPPTSASKGSGKALRKTLPRSNSKYKALPPEPEELLEQSQPPPKRLQSQNAPSNSNIAPVSLTPTPPAASTSQTGDIPLVSSTPTAGVSKPRSVPSALQVQMDKQASDLVSLTFTVWLLQDESRSEPPTGPGERMDMWVRGCVKKCISSALTFLTASGGIFRARSNLKADVDNESIYTDWIMAAPTDDVSIERARGNYSLWDPSLRDSEWQAEKRVLRGLNICYQKALSMTPAANFSATLIYAKAVLNKAITDFETFMPRTITMLPGKRTTPVSTGQPVAVTPVAKAVQSIQPRSTSAVQTAGNRNELEVHPKGKVGKADANKDKRKAANGSGLKLDQAAALGSSVTAKPGRASGEANANAPTSSTALPAAPASSAKIVGSSGSAPASGAAATGNPGVNASVPQQAGKQGQVVSATETVAQDPKGSKSKEVSPVQGKKAEQSAPDPKASTVQPLSAAIGQIPSQSDPVRSTQEQFVGGDRIGSSLMKGRSDTIPAPSAGAPATDVAQPEIVTGTTQGNVVPSVSNLPTSGKGRSKKGLTNLEEASKDSPTGQKQVQTTSKPKGRAGVKTSATKMISQISEAAQRPDTETVPIARLSTSANKSTAQAQSSTVELAVSHGRDTGTSPASAQGTTKSGRTSSKQQHSRAQTRAQKKGSSTGQGKGSRNLESRKQVQQTEPVLSTSMAPSTSTGSQAAVGHQTARLQEIPRKHIALGAPRAPLELPRTTNVQGSGGQTGSLGAGGNTGGPTKRTYPLLSRNQVRASNALPAAPVLSRNQVKAGKRPQLGVAQMTVPAAPQRRVAPGMLPSGMYGPSDEADPMEVDAGRDPNMRRNDTNPVGVDHQEMERAGETGAGNDPITASQPHPPGLPDGSENTAAVFSSNPPVNVISRRQNAGSTFQSTTNKRQIGFKSIPQMGLRQSSQPGLVGDGGALPQLGAQGRALQTSELARTSEPHASDYPYGQSGEPVYSPYNPSGQERDLPVDLMNPPTPSSFAGLDGYGISLGADQVNLQRDSLPATPSDFDRYGIQSPLNLERQTLRSTPHQQVQAHSQGQGQLGHIMNPERRDSGGYSQPQRYQSRGTFQGRR